MLHYNANLKGKARQLRKDKRRPVPQRFQFETLPARCPHGLENFPPRPDCNVIIVMVPQEFQECHNSSLGSDLDSINRASQFRNLEVTLLHLVDKEPVNSTLMPDPVSKTESDRYRLKQADEGLEGSAEICRPR
jgi:hypothetical protein